MTVLVVVTTLCGACAVTTQRVNQFDNFAQAGIAYADAVPAVLDESFRVTVTSDSSALIKARPNLSETARLQFIQEVEVIGRELDGDWNSEERLTTGSWIGRLLVVIQPIQVITSNNR